MLTDTELIRKLEFFEPLDQKIIKYIADLCIVREFSAGDAIVRQGEAGLGLYFITAGSARVEVDRDGHKAVVAELKEGDFLGEFAIIDDKTRSASVICLQDTRCLLLTRDSFAKLLKKYPEIGSQMLRTLVSRIRNATARISQPSGTRVAEPVSAAAPPAALPVADAPSANGRSSGGLAGAAGQITEMLPRPEDIVQFYASTKGKTQEFLSRFVSAIYAMKAMLRFSMAIVGCPVTVTAEAESDELMQAEVNGVKLVLFPAACDQALRLRAYADGAVSAIVFRPHGPEASSHVEVLRLDGPMRKEDELTLRLATQSPMRLEMQGHDGGGIPRRLLAGTPAPAARFPRHWQVSAIRWDEVRRDDRS